jgi:hypothetical protein
MTRMVIIGYCNVTRFSILSSQWSLQTHAISGPAPRGRQRSSSASQMFRSANCRGVDLRAAATILGVPGGSHGTLGAGTFMAQRGRSRPASSANFSAIPASSESNIGRPDRAGGISMA